jgi:hypothetical protein
VAPFKGLAAILALAILTGGCVSTTMAPSATSKSDQTSAATVTVHVFTRGTRVPIQGAFVQCNSAAAYTSPSGESTFSIPVGGDARITVSAPGHQPLGASGVIATNEDWTFYLLPE